MGCRKKQSPYHVHHAQRLANHTFNDPVLNTNYCKVLRHWLRVSLRGIHIQLLCLVCTGQDGGKTWRLGGARASP